MVGCGGRSKVSGGGWREEQGEWWGVGDIIHH